MSAKTMAWMAILALPRWTSAAGNDSSSSHNAESFLSNGLLTQLTLGLIVVLVAAVGLTWLLRRYALPRGGAIQVLGGLPLGSRERLLLIEVNDVRLLIGVTSSQIQALHVFSSPMTVVPPQAMPDSPLMESLHGSMEP